MNETITTEKTNGGNTSSVGKGLALAGVAAATLMMARPAKAVTPALTFNDIPGTGDIKVLNYALALEALEADLYAQALIRLTNGGTNLLGTTITGLQLSATEPDVKYVGEFGTIEQQHRNFLNGALGSQSILLSALNGAKFDFGIQNMSRQQIVEMLYGVENTGVQAYLGAIPFFATKTYLLCGGRHSGHRSAAHGDPCDCLQPSAGGGDILRDAQTHRPSRRTDGDDQRRHQHIGH